MDGIERCQTARSIKNWVVVSQVLIVSNEKRIRSIGDKKFFIKWIPTDLPYVFNVSHIKYPSRIERLN